MTKTRSTTSKQNSKLTTKPSETKTIAIPTHLIELITFLHEANKIQFDLTKELLSRMEDDKSINHYLITLPSSRRHPSSGRSTSQDPFPTTDYQANKQTAVYRGSSRTIFG
jgi:hypothetical protein